MFTHLSHIMAAPQNGHKIDESLPKWLKDMTLNKAIKDQIGDFEKVREITSESVTKQGENYTSLIMLIMAEVELPGI